MAMTSPSRTIPSGRSASASTTWGNCLLKDFLFRENSVKPVGDFTASARYPSSLISQIHVAPSGSFDTDKHSIGSINDAGVLGNKAKHAWIFRSIVFFSKTKAGQISKHSQSPGPRNKMVAR